MLANKPRLKLLSSMFSERSSLKGITQMCLHTHTHTQVHMKMHLSGNLLVEGKVAHTSCNLVLECNIGIYLQRDQVLGQVRASYVLVFDVGKHQEVVTLLFFTARGL